MENARIIGMFGIGISLSLGLLFHASMKLQEEVLRMPFYILDGYNRAKAAKR